jgi:peptidoglycan hydrolase CwlO-like protein
MQISRHIKRLTLVSTSVVALLGGAVIASSSADLQSQINANKSAAATLQSQINSEASQIERTKGGLAVAQAKLSSVNAALDAHIAQLREVQTELMTARDELLALENKLHVAAKYLAANLRSEYENGSPNLVDVILNAHGFSSLLDQVNYIKDAQHRDDEIVHLTKIAQARVQREALHAYKLEIKDRNLTNDILAQRNQESRIQAALAKQAVDEESAQSHTRTRLANVNAQTTKLQQQYAAQVAAAQAAAAAAAAARAAAAQHADQATQQASQQASEQVNQQAGGIAINSGGTVQAPAGAPASVVAMISAGNMIATLPYIWGGGHGSFQALGYDCSGSVSFVLNAGGLLSSPEVSGWFESYGDAGPGQWVTIYANAGHVWMQIAGWRFDTVALAEDGTRWSQGGGEYAGFVVRHPVGL